MDNHESNFTEDYDEAVKALLSPLHQATSPDAIRASAARRTNTLQDMQIYLQRLGLDVNSGQAENIPKLIFHVTGTKGKGSTLALCESILRNAYNLNTGMFTSPHLVCIRERIRVNGRPISKVMFANAYWAVRRKLESFHDESEVVTNGNDLPPLPVLPGYFRMLTLMAIHTFCHCQSPTIDAILLEVGMGGRYDSTNVFEPSIPYLTSQSIPKRILVRGVTLIDYDHMRVLGSTLEQIAWEKGGIFLSNKLANIGRNDGGYSAFLAEYEAWAKMNENREERELSSESSHETSVFASGNNTPQVLNVLRYIINSDSQTGRLEVVDNSFLDDYPAVGLQGDHQRSNAALAVAMCQYAMKEYLASPRMSPQMMQQALALTFWPGRCHSVTLPKIINIDSGIEASVNLRCDGAHTAISMNVCIDWFRSVASGDDKIYRALIFNCSHERNPLPLLHSLHQSKLFHSVYFCHADFERPSMLAKRLEEQWYTQEIAGITLEHMCNVVDAGKKCDALTWQETLANVWRIFNLYDQQLNITGEKNSDESIENISFGMNVKAALASIRKEFSGIHIDEQWNNENSRVEICVTGSLYIVGSALEAVGWEESNVIDKHN
ncbi:hypothetical protein HJC23_006412 [Cyclotella cryptica]|uniref:tetrahydrofolate synthase n=1 Tax=Cyclotella cryptica TaxID=29204 RepID=A0ABD3QW95_9STRA|eukprot:CCRYP_001809-RA/>CCRYP_001809-RA protein AED:0.00 eAED:0.00 QI:543/-1/1/1/-1/1/1/72/607